MQIKHRLPTGISIIALLFILTILLSACSDNNNVEDQEISVILVDGAPLMSMANLMSDEEMTIDGFDITYTITNDSDTLVAALLNQEPDFAVAPINVAALMHNNGSGYRLAAVTIRGILQIVSDQDISSLDELKGQTIIAFGRSGTPGITLRAILNQNGIDYFEPDSLNFTPDPNQVSIVYLTAPSDVRDALATGMEIGGSPASFGLLAEPVATAITGFAQNAGRPGIEVKINLQAEWAKNNDGEIYPQAGLIFHERLLEHNKDFVDSFIDMAELSSIEANVNPSDTGDLAVALGSVAIPNGTVMSVAYNAGRFPIMFTHAKQAEAEVNRYLQIILNENPSLIGGQMPDESFYYER